MPAAHARKVARKLFAAPIAAAIGEQRDIGARLRELRKAAGITQEAIGAQGFVSMPGWIKIENGQRSPSEKLLERLAAWLVQEKVIRANQKTALLNELLALKYAGCRSPFLRRLAPAFLAKLTHVALQTPA